MFRVFVRRGGFNLRLKGFTVSDQPENLDKDRDVDYPAIAEFTVSDRYNEDEQRQRAYEYCDYLNKHLRPIPPIGE